MQRCQLGYRGRYLRLGRRHLPKLLLQYGCNALLELHQLSYLRLRRPSGAGLFHRLNRCTCLGVF